MARTLSSSTLAKIFAQSSDDPMLELVTINHPDLSTPLRFANNTEAVVRNGNTFSPLPMQIALPTESKDEPPRTKIVMDNVSQAAIATLRSLSGAPPTITLRVVRASTPDTLEAGPFPFTLRQTQYNRLVIQGELSFEELLGEPFPAGRFTPKDFPGLFN